MDPLHTVIAAIPLGAYLLSIGLIHLRRAPLVVSGGRDAAALALGLSGLMIVGPMELFLPTAPARHFGAFVWVLLISLYALGITLWILMMRPRLVVYNVTVEQLRPLLATAVEQLDSQARWAGECLVLPQLGVQLHVDTSAAGGVAELVAAGARQNYGGWRLLDHALRQVVHEARQGGDRTQGPLARRGPVGPLLVLTGLAALTLATYLLLSQGPAVAQSLREMLRL